MNHLSSDELSSLLAGTATPEQKQHGRSCEQCRSELAGFEEALSTFRDSVKVLAGRQSGSTVPQSAFLDDASHRSTPFSFRWLLASAAVVTVVAVPVYWRITDLQRSQNAIEDSLLLEQVNAHLSQSVPSSMEPMLDLVSEGYIEASGEQQ